ncbi:putative phage abortive infection protein [Priestia sp. OVS21]|nr:putative phage abortive infection protein [Priestia sp. OVS21]
MRIRIYDRELQGKIALNYLLKKLREALDNTLPVSLTVVEEQRLNQERENNIRLVEQYQKFFDKYENMLGHYMRNLYRIVKFISESNLAIEEKRNYFGILRAQWSTNEFLLIYFNIVSKEGIKFKEFVQAYDVLDIHANKENKIIQLKENLPIDEKYKGLYTHSF